MNTCVLLRLMRKAISWRREGPYLRRLFQASTILAIFCQNPAIEDIHDDQAVVMLINTEQDAILVTHLKRGEGIATGRRGCQHIALAGLEQLLIQLTERKDREKRLFLPEAADTNVHIL